MSNHRQSGFTLVEVAVAIAILGVALTSLIVLHTGYLNSFVKERNLVQAALYAKQMLSLIEASGKAPELGSEEGDLDNYLRDKTSMDSDEAQELSSKTLGWRYEMSVEPVPIPSMGTAEEALEDALRQVDLIISWGPGIGERFRVVYFAKP